MYNTSTERTFWVAFILYFLKRNWAAFNVIFYIPCCKEAGHIFVLSRHARYDGLHLSASSLTPGKASVEPGQQPRLQWSVSVIFLHLSFCSFDLYFPIDSVALRLLKSHLPRLGNTLSIFHKLLCLMGLLGDDPCVSQAQEQENTQFFSCWASFKLFEVYCLGGSPPPFFYCFPVSHQLWAVPLLWFLCPTFSHGEPQYSMLRVSSLCIGCSFWTVLLLTLQVSFNFLFPAGPAVPTFW